MSRSYSIIVGIVLGALATAAGLGFFLFKANSDRMQLSTKLAETVDAANRTRIESQASIDEANRKLQAASQEVARAQIAMKEVEDERKLIAAALPLTEPSGKTIKGWNETVALGLGLSLKIPSTATISGNSSQALIADWTLPRTPIDARWLIVTPYSEQQEINFLATFATSTPAAYVVQGHVLSGLKGWDALNARVHVLRVRAGGKSTHLIWLRDASAVVESSLSTTVLSTIRFAN